MPSTSPRIRNTQAITSHESDGPLTRQLAVSLTATNYIAQYAGGGGALADTTGPWTAFTPTRLPQIVYSGGAAVTYTIAGTDIYTGAVITEAIDASAGVGTYKATQPYATITAFSSDIDPVGTTDLQGGDTWVHPDARAIRVGASGDIAFRPVDNDADVTLAFLAGLDPSWTRIIRLTGTTATGLGLGW